MLNYFFLLLLLITTANAAENCTTPVNEAGQCVPVKSCSLFSDYLTNTKINLTPQFYAYYNKSVCGFIEFEGYVCCASRHLNADIEISSTTTNQPIISTTSITEDLFLQPLTNSGPPNMVVSTRRSEHVNFNLLEMKRCGILNNDRISYGNKTDLNQYPWMALLQYNTSNGLEFGCGGSLISKRYVLTAAHCVKTISPLVSVRLGEHDINNVTDCDEIDNYCAPPVQDIEIEDIIIHTEYRRRTLKSDIALIRLKTEANIQEENVKIICLPVSRKFETIEHPVAIITGWGRTENSRQMSNELLQAEIPVHPISVCQNFYKSRVQLTDSHLCAGGKNNVDTCYGDSGGPMFAPARVSDTQKVPQFYQIGIVSAGYIECGQLNSYSIFTKVSTYIDWILNNIKP